MTCEFSSGQVGHIYVSSEYGDDANSGFCPTEAKRTIAAALALATTNVVHLDRGRYRETVDLRPHPFVKLVGVPSGLNFGVTIEAPQADADTIHMGFRCELQDLYVSGFQGPGWTGRAVAIEAGAGYTTLRNVGIGNGDGYAAGPTDPAQGGTGIYLRDNEDCVFEQVNLSYLRTGVDIDDTGSGNSMHTFRRLNIVGCWREVSIQGMCGTLLFERIKCVNGQMPREHGYIWDVACAHSTFTNVEITEGGLAYKARFGGSENLDRRGNYNTFIDCESSPQCEWQIDSHGNKLLGFMAQNKLALNGSRNDVDGIYEQNGGWVEVNGLRNSVRRYWRPDKDINNQFRIVNNGTGTILRP